MKKNKFILLSIFVLMSLSLVFTVFVFFQQNKNQIIRIKSDALDVIDQRLTSTYIEINKFPSGAADDLLFLSRLADFQKIDEVKKDFLDFLAQTDAYYQISFINRGGTEIVRAEFDGQTRKIVSDLQKQNQENTLDFNFLKNLKNGEVYIFPLKLEVKPKKITVLNYATPIFNQKTNKFEGIILVKVYADYFLDNIRQSKREGEITYLIDINGFYLANPDKNKEFGNLLGNKKDNFFIDYPAAVKDTIISCNERRQETNQKIFTYRCINPTISNFETYQGVKTIEGNAVNNYQWLLMTVTDKTDGLKDYSTQKWDRWWIITIQVIIQVLVFILIWFNQKIDEKNN